MTSKSRLRPRPQDLVVAPSHPFKNDLLNRKAPAEALTRLVQSFEGPCVLAVDADWGNGKTTFVNMWGQSLINQGFPLVDFNAWETDFSGNPFLALSAEITDGLERCGLPGGKSEELKRQAAAMLRSALPGAFAAGAAAVGLNPHAGKEIAAALEAAVDARQSEYTKAKKSRAKFEKALKAAVNELAQEQKGRPLIVMIDELDRCRPSYAVELLEAAKHFFSVDGIVFVLAINRSELVHSIQGLYGGGCDADGYLHRFIDVEVRLPDSDRARFIEAEIERMPSWILSGETQDSNRQQDVSKVIVKDLAEAFFQMPTVSLRQVRQAFHRLGLVFGSLDENELPLASLAVPALIFRTLDADLYHRFRRHEISDKEAVDGLYKRMGGPPPLMRLGRIWFEAALTAGWCEIERKAAGASSPADILEESPLHKHYAQQGGGNPDPSTFTPERKHAQAVLQQIRNYCSGSAGAYNFFFTHAAERIELFSQEFTKE